MKFTLVFVVKQDDGRTTEEVVAIGECLDDMPEAFGEMYYSRYVHYECRPYDGETVGDVIVRPKFEKLMYPACEKCRKVNEWNNYYTVCKGWCKLQCENESEAERWVNSDRYKEILAQIEGSKS